MFKCDLCNKKMEMDQGKLLYDKFRKKDVLYCHECAFEYEDANKAWDDPKAFHLLVDGVLRKQHKMRPLDKH